MELGGRLQGELESKCAGIKSMEVVQNTMIELTKDKDKLIVSQKTLRWHAKRC